MKIVFGPRRMNAGVQPLKRNLKPSFRKDVESTSIAPVFPDCELLAGLKFRPG